MAGNVKCELSSGSPQDSGFAGTFANGSRGVHPVASIDRIVSFRENINGRAFTSGTSMSKGKAIDLPPISQCLMLEPVTLGDQKYTRFGELRRALGYSFGSTSEDNSFGAAHSKHAPVLGVDELKRFRGSIQDGNDKARIRVKKLDDSLNKLTTYIRKQQIMERSSGSNLLKSGTQSYRKSPDQMTQKIDDKGKNALSKRARTPVADMRLDCRGTGIPRQHMVLGKDKDISKQGSLSSDSMEEKIRKLPAGGESWDKKMKRKRSVSNVFSRPVDGDGEIKRAMHSRVSSDSGLPSSDAPPFRSASSNGIGNNTKSDSISTPGSTFRPTPKNEMEKVSLSRELGGMNKEKILQKGNNKFSMRDETHLVNQSLLTKGKASRGPRAGPQIMDNSSTFSHMASMPEDWEQPSNVNKIHSLGGINNRKRVFSSESSSPPVTQWVGQRPQKISRIRRTNIISPTSNNDEALVSSEACASPEFNAVTSSGFNGSFPAWSNASNTSQLKVKCENTTSPARLSESEETGAVENRSKERTAGRVESVEKGINGYKRVGSPGLLPKKSKLLGKEEIGDGVRRQGRSGRSSSFTRGGMSSPLKEKIDSPAGAKPVRSTKPDSDKNGSKSGRPPLKKHSERKGFTRLGLVPNGHSPDCTGESDDDREDLIAAAQFASSANSNACSSPFWEKMESLFTSRSEEKSYLKQQLKHLEEHQEMFASASIMKDALKEEKHQPSKFGSQRDKVDLSYGAELTYTEGLDKQGQDSDFYCRRDSAEGPQGITPLYQRVLSALIMEDEFEEFEKSNCGGKPFLSGRESTCSMGDNIFSTGDITYNRCSNNDVSSQLDLWEGDCSFYRSEFGILPASSQSNFEGSITPQINISNDFSSQVQSSQMSMDEKLLTELQSIGLYPETVPDLAEGEDEGFAEEISQLERQFCQKVRMKKLCLERIWNTIKEENDVEERVLEQVAMSRLIWLAYRKLLATQRTAAAKIGVSKVPRHVALAFVKRTLARCRKFENTGKSCFTDPLLRDFMLAAPASFSKAERKSGSLTDHNLHSEPKASGSTLTGADMVLDESCNLRLHQSDHPSAKDGSNVDRGKKKEVLLDNVGNVPAALKPPLGNTPMGGAKGKRSERDPASKNGRPSINNLRGDRKAKSKPKQKAANFSTHPVFPSSRGSREPESKEAAADLTNLPLSELDSIGLGVDDNAFGGNQDLSSWFNFDEDNLQDHDSMGLEIPMDDLSELNMLL